MNKLILSAIVVVFSSTYLLAQSTITKKSNMSTKLETAILANGCFWCTEAIFQRLEGVETVISGYSGGTSEHPTYTDISTGTTGHAEAIQIEFNSEIVSFQEILDVFFSTHDPTTLNKQGYDVGSQYRSAIFFNSTEQKRIAENFMNELTEAHVFDKPIVTELKPFSVFYKAEKYHQNYYNNNKNQAYCRAVINPKLEKFIKKYKAKLKKL